MHLHHCETIATSQILKGCAIAVQHGSMQCIPHARTDCMHIDIMPSGADSLFWRLRTHHTVHEAHTFLLMSLSRPELLGGRSAIAEVICVPGGTAAW